MSQDQADYLTEGNLAKKPTSQAEDYRAFVGPAATFDVMSALQFNLLTTLGLREHHSLLDIGCGSLRAGRLFIPYLLPERYFGVEPNDWLIDEGIRNEVGKDVIEMKRPAFSNSADFAFETFDQSFDFIIAQSIFSHASLAQVKTCLAEAKKVMKPTTIFAATFVMGDEDYTSDAWVYPGCVTYREETFRELAQEQGLVCKMIDWAHPAQQTWTLITHPELEARLEETSDTSRLLRLEQEIDFYKVRLARLEGHPYMKFGMKVLGALQTVRRSVRSRDDDSAKAA